MSYCTVCGHELSLRENGIDGLVPYCPSCEEFRFPKYSVAVSAIVCNPARDKMILIQQYGRPDNILVAGYVNLGESLEAGLCREVKEELGLQVTAFQYLRSEYFPRSNTLMCSFIAAVDSEDLSGINEEIDRLSWFSFAEAKRCIKPGSLAERFLLAALDDKAQGKIALLKTAH